MAEVFVNSLTSSAGVVATSSSGSIGANATTITGISTVNVGLGYMVDNQHFRGGTKVSGIGVNQVTVSRPSTNSVTATTQIVKFLGPTTCYASPSGTKSILIGGTFANLTKSNINIFVEVVSGSNTSNIANEIPVPTGSSFVISDAGKTILLASDELRVYTDTDDGVSVTLGILQGVN